MNDTTQSPWDAVGQLETASGNLCTATLIAPNLALTAGHCLLTPPKGKADKAVALRFVSNKGLWRYEIHDIEGRVDPTLGKRLKADGDGWIVPPAAAPWDFGLIVLRNPPSGITPLPLFEGDKAALTAALKAAGRKVTQAGYPEDHLDTLYSHQNCEVTGWAQTSVMSHQCDTLPGDSGSPLMLHTDDGWQLIGCKVRLLPRKIAGAPITGPFLLPVFATGWINCRKIMFKRCPTARAACSSGKFHHDHSSQQQDRPIQPLRFNR